MVPRIRRVLPWLLLTAIFASVSLAIVYVAIAMFSIDDLATTDSRTYFQMFHGHWNVEKPYRYRVIIPWLAHLLPAPPHAAISSLQVTPDKLIALRFGVLDVAALTIAGTALVAFLRRLGFPLIIGLLGGLLFFGSWEVTRFAGEPLVDAGSFAALAVTAYAIVSRRLVLLTLTVLIGMFVKETTVLAVVLVPLLITERRSQIRHLLACLPGVVAYLVVRFVISPTSSGYTYSLGQTARSAVHLGASFARDFMLSCALSWALAAIGWRLNRRELPRRLLLLVPVVVLAALAVGSNYGRVLYLAFPAVIPFALLALERILGDTEPAELGLQTQQSATRVHATGP